MSTYPPTKVIIQDDYNINIGNTKLNNTFPLSSLGVQPTPSPAITILDQKEPNYGTSSREVINIEDIQIEEVYDPIFEVTTKKDERSTFDIMRATAEESLPEAAIIGVEFSLVKRNDLINYTIVVNSEEREGPATINDPRLGVVKGNDRCGTCYRTVENCPGHLGRIPLHKPITNPFYRRHIIRFLNIFCNTCGALLLTENQIEDLERTTHAATRMHLVEQHVKNKKGIKHTHRKDIRSECAPGTAVGELLSCISNPTYVLDKKGYKIEYTVGDSKGERHERTIEDIIKIFEMVSPEDAKLLGLGNNMPIDFLIFDIIVVPPKLRGASHKKEAKNESDRMADLYISIIKADKITRNEKISQVDSDINRRYIYENLRTLIESKETKSYRGTSQVSIRQLIQGKEGIFRQFIMSKRADFTARSVIGPDPDADFGEISIPREWADRLTVNEIVFQVNMARLNKLLQQGRITNVVRASGHFKGQLSRVNERNRDNIKLEIGDKVDRWLQDGDYVTVNRMPSLHKQSMMTMRVKLWGKRIIGLHLSYTTPFNADFDGDEMNLHSFQIVEAIAEAAHLMNVESCIPNEQSNSNIMGLVMDNTLGGYLLTYLDDIIDEDTWNDCLCRITTRDDLATLDERLFEMGIKKYTGKALFSALLPQELYYEKGDVLIVKGILLSGVITKDHVGASSGSIIQAIYNNPEIMVRRNQSNEDTFPGLNRGLRRAALFIRNAYHVLNRWLSEHGASLGLRDCRVGDSIFADIKKLELSKLRLLVNQLGAGPFATERDRRVAEAEILTKTGEFMNVMKGTLMDNISKDNNFYILVNSKTKGNIVNLSHMAMAVGQQTYFGERMKLSISHDTRVLPHFDVGEDDLASRGFIQSGYIEGLTAIEYFDQGVAAREGLLISATSISEIGMIRRNMFKMLEDCKIAVDGTVRDPNLRIMQSLYGDDGFSSSKLTRIMQNKGTANEDSLLAATNEKSLADQLNAKYGFPRRPKEIRL